MEFFGKATKSATPILSYGSEGDLVKIVQAMLYCKGYNTNGIDGLYYDGTQYAVKVYQEDHNLSIDGIYR